MSDEHGSIATGALPPEHHRPSSEELVAAGFSGRELLFRLLSSDYFSPLLALHYIFKLAYAEPVQECEIHANFGVIRFVCNRLMEPRFQANVAEFIPQFWLVLITSLIFSHLTVSMRQHEFGHPMQKFIIEMSKRDVQFMTRSCWYLIHYLSSERYREQASIMLQRLLFNSEGYGSGLNCAVAVMGTGCLMGMLACKESFQQECKDAYADLKDTGHSRPTEISENNWKIAWSDLYSGNAFAACAHPSIQEEFHAITRLVDSLHKISNTLYLFPARQRQRILVGELNLLNYNLPCKYMIPGLKLCGPTQACIVRIAANECTTLDSAERVPILIYLEILEDCQELAYTTGEQMTSKAQLRAVSACKEIEHASIMLSQLAHISNVNMNPDEIEEIKHGILEEMNKNLQKLSSNFSSPSSYFPIGSLVDCGSPLEGFSSHASQEDWDAKVARIRKSSPWGSHPQWRLCSFIVKSNTDMRQEQLAIQLLSLFQSIFAEEGIPCWVFPYAVVVTPSGGLIQTIVDSFSLHSIKRLALLRNPGCTSYSLLDWFNETFGYPTSQAFQRASFEFMRSLAAYSLFSYIFQLKDRHNGNILIDKEGHLIHIDFGFFLGNAPGRLVAFETAPFKLLQEWCDILEASSLYDECKTLFYCGMVVVKKHYDRIKALLECMSEAELTCLSSSDMQSILAGIEQRLLIADSNVNLREIVDRLFESSKYNSFTRIYDSYQYYAHGIL